MAKNLDLGKMLKLVDYDPNKKWPATFHQASGREVRLDANGNAKVESPKEFWARPGNTGQETKVFGNGLKWKKDPETGQKIYEQPAVDTSAELAREQSLRSKTTKEKEAANAFSDTNRLSSTTRTYRAPDGSSTPPKLTPLTNDRTTTNALARARGTNAPVELKQAAEAYQDKKAEANAAITATNQATNSVPGRLKASIVAGALENVGVLQNLVTGKTNLQDVVTGKLTDAITHRDALKADPDSPQRSIDAADNKVGALASQLSDVTRQLDTAKTQLHIASERYSKVSALAASTAAEQAAALTAADDLERTASRLASEARALKKALHAVARE